MLFTARYPEGMYNFVAGYLRLTTRVYAYALLLTDELPSFGGGPEPEYPIKVDVAPRQERYNRWKTFFKYLLWFPQMLIGGYGLAFVVQFAAFISWFRILFAGRQSITMHEALVGSTAYLVRSNGFILLLTEAHPRLLDVQRYDPPADAPASGAELTTHTVYRTFETADRREFVRITEDVQAAVDESGIAEGMVLVSAMHITAGVWVNDAEPGLHEDTLEWLDKLAPPSWSEPSNDVARELIPDPGDYRHHRGGEDNGDAHLKNLLVHHQVVLPVTEGRLDLGPWQQVFYTEFDGRRPKRMVIKVIGE